MVGERKVVVSICRPPQSGAAIADTASTDGGVLKKSHVQDAHRGRFGHVPVAVHGRDPLQPVVGTTAGVDLVGKSKLREQGQFIDVVAIPVPLGFQEPPDAEGKTLDFIHCDTLAKPG
jgi:hypothetical protein